MTDKRGRQGAGVPPTRVAMPKVPVTSRQTAKKVAPQVLELEKHVGKRVKVTNILNREFTGTVYSCENGELVLDTDPDAYHIIQLSKITKFEALTLASTRNLEAEAKLREKERLAKAKAERLAKPPGVSDVGHRLFLTFERTLPVRWADKTIVILDNVLIEPPYDVENCKAPAKHEKQLQRVKELVKAELAKMPKENTWDRRGG